jgi:Holliday junction DNA helicase RuvA
VIARLDGTLVERVFAASAPHVIVDCGGVGYDVACSAYTLAGLPADGERVVLRVYTHAQENKIALYGFIDAQERALFDLLITVKNVGPTTAIAILSGSSPRDIAQLIAQEDVPGLVRIKGVGKKTAELLVVELHDKCCALLLAWDASGKLRPVASAIGTSRGIKISRHPLIDEVSLALVGMGWKPAEVEQAIGELRVPPDATDTTIDQLVRQALRSMPR